MLEGERQKREGDTLRTLRAVLLSALTALAIWLCWLLTAPFFSALTWGFTLAVGCAPLRTWLFTRMPKLPATLLVVSTVSLAIAVPAIFLFRELFQESVKAQALLRTSIRNDDWRGMIAASRLGPAWIWAEQELDLSEIAQQIAGTISGWIAPLVTRSARVITQAGAALLAFFFFVRDQETMLSAIRGMLPLSATETDRLFDRVSSAVRSAVYGLLLVGLLQGFLGGVIFALVNLPASLFWGAVMSILSVLPVLGAFVVWIPASIYLLIGGHWIAASVVAVWGVAVINPVDNLLYPVLVGDRLGLHPLVLFIAFVGGMIVFGPAGLILGPCIIASAVGIAELWQARIAAVAEQGGG